ncbi:MAG TPA: hypothetical protein VNT99_08545 [Methylomirabilota bacterium]|nr:hypothetical protein [Methylomirabilota bacterium]
MTAAVIRKHLANASALVALSLDGFCAVVILKAIVLLIVLGRGQQASDFIALAHSYSFHVALAVVPFAALALLFGRRQLGLWAGIVAIALWLFASMLIPWADISGR